MVVDKDDLMAAHDAGAEDIAMDDDGFEVLGIDQKRRLSATGVPPERIVVTTGSSGAFMLAFLAAFDPGQRVAIAEPGYPGYRHILSLLGLEAASLPARHDADFRVSAELAGAAGPLDGLLVASPANPTGTVLEPERLRALVDFAAARDMLLILDEIYHGIT